MTMMGGSANLTASLLAKYPRDAPEDMGLRSGMEGVASFCVGKVLEELMLSQVMAAGKGQESSDQGEL